MSLHLIPLLVLVAVAFAAPTAAQAHSWYSVTCCSGLDCQPVATWAVQATGVGWEILETGEVIPYGDRREQTSQDSDFHRCAFQSGEMKGQTRCLYVPGFGM